MNTENSENRIKHTNGDSDKLIAFVLHQGEKYLEDSDDPEHDLEKAENNCGYVYFG
jgi:hypothetical protein